MGGAGDAAAVHRSTADAGIGLWPGPLLRGDCRNHALPREYRVDADVSRPPQTAHAFAAVRRNSMRRAIFLQRLNLTPHWLHPSETGPRASGCRRTSYI